MSENDFIRKPRLISKTHDVTTWETNSYNSHITEHLKTQRQLGNEVWPVKGN